MKVLITRTLAIIALCVALSGTASAQVSNRGLYEGNLSSGGKAVFFVQGNQTISVYVFDTSGHVVHFGGGTINPDGSFTVNTNGNVPVTGTLTNGAITATYQGQNITASSTPLFGNSFSIAGRFSGIATSAGNPLTDVRFIVDSLGNIFFVANQNGTVIGGFGTVTFQQGGNNDGDDEEDDNDDEENDDHEDTNAPTFTGSFTINLVGGGTVTGTFNFAHEMFNATFMLNGVTFHFIGMHESASNRLSNISTRGFVTTGQGQLISGFIIRGGPELVLVRVLGPTLSNFGVSPVLADPQVQLFHNGAQIASNNDWQTNSNASDITASGLAPQNPKESAILIRLEPGSYTAVVTGADGGSGIALVEVYELSND
jgi:hypothetical protein